MVEYADLIKSGIGAVLGFLFAQLVNVARLVWGWWVAPRLSIEVSDNNCVILAHHTAGRFGELHDEKIYGFYVRNVGREIASGVRVQLIKIEFRSRSRPEFATISEQAYDLALYRGADTKSEDMEAVLVPGAAVLVELAGWQEHYDAIFPAVSGLPEYYEEICAGATEYRFTVAAFDDKARFVQRTLTVALAKSKPETVMQDND